jgi:outer membrane protein assembly factor BamD
MMKSAPALLAGLLFCTLLHSNLSAQGLLSKIRGKEKEKVLTTSELQDQEAQGAASFVKAEEMEKAGKLRSARDLYASIAKSYPNTKVAGEAQFRSAQIRDREGEGKKAYDEYRLLITKYRSSPHFQTAIERQYAIAESLRTEGKKGMFGVGASIQPTDLKKIYQEIADAAPYTQYAPRSLMAIGALNASEGLKLEAILSYQSVVDNYRGTAFAKDSQFEIYKLRGEAAASSNSPSEDRAQVDAGLDFVSQNPTDMRSEQVKAGLQEIEERSLEKMFKTGQFYEESGNYKSALVYYREIAKKPDSKYFAQAGQRITAIQKIEAGEEITEKANLFGKLPSLPALPKIEKPNFRFGKKDEVLPLPAEADPAANPTLPAQ